MNKMVVKNGKKKSKSSSSYHLNLSKCNITCFKSITLARSKIINFEEFKYSFTQLGFGFLSPMYYILNTFLFPINLIPLVKKNLI